MTVAVTHFAMGYCWTLRIAALWGSQGGVFVGIPTRRFI